MKNTFHANIIAVAAFLGMLGVAFGAFGAHFLKTRLDANAIDVLKTGVLYLFIHTLATLMISRLADTHPTSRLLRSVCVLFLLGVFLFSGSLFLISTSSLTGVPTPYIGFLTPLGGLCFIAGWLVLLIYALSGRKGQVL